MNIAGFDPNLLLCLASCVLVTQLPKVLPITFLRGDHLPALLRKWLDFIPVAVMAALVGLADTFILLHQNRKNKANEVK